MGTGWERWNGSNWKCGFTFGLRLAFTLPLAAPLAAGGRRRRRGPFALEIGILLMIELTIWSLAFAVIPQLKTGVGRGPCLISLLSLT